MKASVLFLVAVVIAVLLVLSAAFYIVPETEQVIITQFGKPVGGPMTKSGIHFKVALHPGSQPDRQTGARMGWRQLPRCRPRTSSTSSSTRSAVGASAIRCSISSGCAMNAARNRGSTTFSAARRAIRSRAHELVELIRTNKDRKAAIDDTSRGGQRFHRR